MKQNKTQKSTYNPKEWEFPPEADKTGNKWAIKHRIAYIKKLAETVGLYNLNVQDLARTTGVSRRQIYRDVDRIYDMGVDPATLRHAKVELRDAFKFIAQEARAEAIKLKGTKKLAALHTLMDHAKSYTDYLERFNLKRPIEIESVDRIQIVFPEWGDKPKKKDS